MYLLGCTYLCGRPMLKKGMFFLDVAEYAPIYENGKLPENFPRALYMISPTSLTNLLPN